MSKAQVSKHVHSIKIPFELRLGSGKTLNRFVYVYLIYAKQICLIDSGVSGSKDLIFDYIKETGRDPSEIATMVVTHAHPDHIGGALGVQKSTGCVVAAHRDDIPWIEDIELQYRERPVPSFHSLVKGSIEVGRALKDGDSLELGDDNMLQVVHTPGHSRGHISLIYKNDGVLISGDCVPVAGGLPIYEDVVSSIKSIKRLGDIKGLKVLLSSWDEPRYGDQIYKALDEGIKYIRNIHSEVIKGKAILHSSDIQVVARQVCGELGLPETALNPIFFKTVEAHLKVSDCNNL